jgi:hypothetical protein
MGLAMSSLSRIDQIYSDWKKLSPSNKIKVRDGEKIGVISAVGNDCVFIKWFPFISYVATESEKYDPDNVNIIGTLYPVKRNKAKNDFFTF